VSPAVGFVLHTADFNGPDTQVVNDKMALTTEKSVLKAIAEGQGPRRRLFAFGYAGWGAGQLEGEIARGDWFNVPADEQLIFDEDLKTIWSRASDKVRVRL
jgi:putative transcriptional regulator